MKIGEILWLALRYAIAEREVYIDAWGADAPEVEQAKKEIKAFNKTLIKLFGTNKSKLESMMDKMATVSVFKILEETIEDLEESNG